MAASKGKRLAEEGVAPTSPFYVADITPDNVDGGLILDSECFRLLRIA
jgi:hypothetical protein